jgi:hypothetical protein
VKAKQAADKKLAAAAAKKAKGKGKGEKRKRDDADDEDDEGEGEELSVEKLKADAAAQRLKLSNAGVSCYCHEKVTDEKVLRCTSATCPLMNVVHFNCLSDFELVPRPPGFKWPCDFCKTLASEMPGEARLKKKQKKVKSVKPHWVDHPNGGFTRR